MSDKEFLESLRLEFDFGEEIERHDPEMEKRTREEESRKLRLMEILDNMGLRQRGSIFD